MPAKISKEVRESQINSIRGISFIRWDGEYKNSNSRAIVSCDRSHEWSVNINGLINGGSGCQRCKADTLSRLKRGDELDVISKIQSVKNVRFIGWVNGYENQKSLALVSCGSCFHEFKSNSNNLINSNNGCPKCSGKYRWTASERIQQINSLNYMHFLRWDCEYKNCKSKAVVECSSCGNQWSAQVSSILSAKRGCPSCARGGYDSSKVGILYLLRSSCGGMVKIGITNNARERHSKLKSATPFEFDCIEMVSGDGAVIQKLERCAHSRMNRVDFNFKFDGFTEWFDFDCRIVSVFKLINDSIGSWSNCDHDAIEDAIHNIWMA